MGRDSFTIRGTMDLGGRALWGHVLDSFTWDMTHSHVCVPWLIHICTTFTCVTWLSLTRLLLPHGIQMSVPGTHTYTYTHTHTHTDTHEDMTDYKLALTITLFMCVTRLIHMCDMTHSDAWRVSFTCETWILHTWGMTPLHVWHNLFTSDVTHLDVWHDPFTCVPWLIHV